MHRTQDSFDLFYGNIVCTILAKGSEICLMNKINFVNCILGLEVIFFPKMISSLFCCSLMCDINNELN